MRLLLLAIDQLDRRLLQRCVDAGGMPTLAGLLERGRSGAMAQPQPHATAALWATVATGWPACRHGVLADRTVGPGGWSARAVQPTDWRVAPFWHRTAQPVAVLNWPGTAGATCSAAPALATGEAVARGWLRAPGVAHGDAPLQAWGLDPACVAPAADLEAVRELRVHPDDITPLMLAQLLQGVPEAEHSAPLQALCRSALAELATWQALSLDLLAHGCPQMVLRWDALALLATRLLHDDGRQRISRPWQLLGNLCQLMDLMLHALLQHLDADGHVLLVCAGTLPAALRPGPQGALDRAEPGFAVMAGPGFAADSLHQGGSLFDVLPSLLAASGQLAAPGLPGRSWHGSALATGAARPRAWPAEDAEGADMLSALPPLLDPADLAPPAQRLPLGSDWLQAQGLPLPDLAPLRRIAAETHACELHGLALSLRETGHDAIAEKALAAALDAAPQATGPQWLALLWAAERGDAPAARGLIAQSHVLAAQLPPGDLREAVLACAARDWPVAEPLLRRQLGVRHLPLNVGAWLGRALAGQGRHAEAVDALQEALASPYESLATVQLLAQVQLRLGRLAAAEVSARQSIAMSPDSAMGHALLAEVLAAGGQRDAAIAAQWRACQLAPQLSGLRARWGELVRPSMAR